MPVIGSLYALKDNVCTVGRKLIIYMLYRVQTMGYLIQLLIYVGVVVKRRETVERLGLHCLGIKIDALVSVFTYLCNILKE
jgi:hypothetical protein